MTCCESILSLIETRQQNELSEADRERIQHHIKGCDQCRQTHQQNYSVDQWISVSTQQWEPTEKLWQRIEQSDQPIASSSRSKPQFRRGFRAWAVAAVLILTVGLSVVHLMFENKPVGESLVANALVNEFHIFVISRRGLDYNHQQPNPIRQWFSSKVDFRVPLPAVINNLQLSGGRLCNMLDQRVVSFMYRSEAAWISLYIMKNATADNALSPPIDQMIQGYGYIQWIENGLQYSLVGDIPIERLRKFAVRLNAYQSLVHSPARPSGRHSLSI